MKKQSYFMLSTMVLSMLASSANVVNADVVNNNTKDKVTSEVVATNPIKDSNDKVANAVSGATDKNEAATDTTESSVSTSTKPSAATSTSQKSSSDVDKKSESSSSDKKDDAKMTTKTWGTVTMSLSDDGTLTMSSGKLGKNDGEGQSISERFGSSDASKIKKVVIAGIIQTSDNQLSIFRDLTNLESISNLYNLDTSQMTNFMNFFAQDKSLKSLNLSGMDTSSAKSMSHMFYNCTSLVSLDCSTFDTSNVTDMQSMFATDKALKSVDMSSFDTSKVTNMSSMFAGTGISKIDVSNFNTSNVTDMSMMFSTVPLTRLDISNFDTSKVTNMKYMLAFNRKLRVLTLGSKFNFVNGTDASIEPHGDTDKLWHRWQNVGSGTETAPKGSNKWSTEDFMKNYDPSKDADTYVWEPKIPGGNVTVHFVDEKGRKIYKDDVMTGNIGELYDSPDYDFTGYTFVKVEGNPKGEFTDKPQEVTFVYKKDVVAGGDITVHYQDKDGKAIAGDKVIKGNVDDKYKTEKLDIKGYTFKEVKGKAEGTFTKDPQTVTYIYTKDPVVAGNITVHYQDEDGNSIAHGQILMGYVGDPYTAKQLKIDGYVFKEVKGNVKGKFTEKEQSVTFIYSKNSADGNDDITPNDDDNNNVPTPSDDNNNVPTLPVDNGGSESTPMIVNNNTTPAQGAVTAHLPQTGEHASIVTSVVGAILLAMASVAGFVLNRKKSNK